MSAESRQVELEVPAVESTNSNIQPPRSGDDAEAQPLRHENGASGAYQACVSCRTTKQKCDGMRPCSNCAASHVVCDQSTLSPPAVGSLPSKHGENSIRKPMSRKRSRTVRSEPRLFACFFHKRDPAKFNKSADIRYKSCPAGFSGMARLKEHCNRTHLAPPMCPRCHKGFSSDADLQSHMIKAEACPVQSTRSDINGITNQQKIIWAQRTKGAKTDEEKWAQLFNILFPDDPNPSPYIETVQRFSAPADETFFKGLDDVIQSILQREASYLSDTATTQLVKSLVSGVEGVMKEYAKGDFSSAHLQMQPVTATKKDWSSRPLNHGDAFASADERSDSRPVFSEGDRIANTALSPELLNYSRANNNSDTTEASGSLKTLRTSSSSMRSTNSFDKQEPASTAAPVTPSTNLLKSKNQWKSHENLSIARDGPFPQHINEMNSSSTVETEGSLECNMCGATFRIPSELRKHALMHTRPYKCEIRGCLRSEGFSTASDLERHQKAIHNITSSHDVLWRCASVGCTYTSPRRDNFRQHLARMHPHEDERALIQRSEYPVEHDNVDIN